MSSHTASRIIPDVDRPALVGKICKWGRDLGFQQVGITGIDLGDDERRLNEWLAAGFHGEMDYMARHGSKRSRPAELRPATLSVIAARMNYLPESMDEARRTLADPLQAYVSRYALGRDYHKLMRRRLRRLGEQIAAEIGGLGYRVFTDSAPVLERALARNGGLGWIGKHSNLISRQDGSWFFLGEIYTDLALPPSVEHVENHCGGCTSCIDVCPTQAIVAPYRVDARRCISYLTIEYRGVIPETLRPLIGNRIFGCDDCQLFCPWNRFAGLSPEQDYKARAGLDSSSLLALFQWSASEFLTRTEGSAIKRISYAQWQRNLAVALGNAPRSKTIHDALADKLSVATPLGAEHIAWAMAQHDDRD